MLLSRVSEIISETLNPPNKYLKQLQNILSGDKIVFKKVLGWIVLSKFDKGSAFKFFSQIENQRQLSLTMIKFFNVNFE